MLSSVPSGSSDATRDDTSSEMPAPTSRMIDGIEVKKKRLPVRAENSVRKSLTDTWRYSIVTSLPWLSCGMPSDLNHELAYFWSSTAFTPIHSSHSDEAHVTAAITGIQTRDDAQFIYVDTPGFQTRHANALNKTLNKTVSNTLTSSDVILFLVEAGTFSAADQQVVDLLPKDVPVILVINKSDRVKDKAALMPFAQKVAALHNFAAIVPVSAKLRFQTDALEREIRTRLPENPPVFGPDDITDRSEKFLAAEIVREKVFRLLGDELPYTSTVTTCGSIFTGGAATCFSTCLARSMTTTSSRRTAATSPWRRSSRSW